MPFAALGVLTVGAAPINDPQYLTSVLFCLLSPEARASVDLGWQGWVDSHPAGLHVICMLYE